MPKEWITFSTSDFPSLDIGWGDQGVQLMVTLTNNRGSVVVELDAREIARLRKTLKRAAPFVRVGVAGSTD